MNSLSYLVKHYSIRYQCLYQCKSFHKKLAMRQPTLLRASALVQLKSNSDDIMDGKPLNKNTI